MSIDKASSGWRDSLELDTKPGSWLLGRLRLEAITEDNTSLTVFLADLGNLCVGGGIADTVPPLRLRLTLEAINGK